MTFQFTPLREGRPAAPCFAVVIVSDFNSRPSARGDAIEFVEGYQVIYFNSRPSARGDSMSSSSPSSVSDFNSRPSARGDFEVEICPFEAVQFQFTPLREGRLVHGVCWGYWNLISIHAPPRGATKRAGAVFHAGRDFNSRPSARGDAARDRFFERLTISIHAPPRGATRSPGERRCTASFQFTPLREGRPFFPICWNCCRTFQFTPLREGRR